MGFCAHTIFRLMSQTETSGDCSHFWFRVQLSGQSQL
jgi:hypothetical protein